jgi:hypothetical protein
MDWTGSLRGLVGAALVMIALLFASSAAYAHAGHGRAASVEPAAAIHAGVDAPAGETEPESVREVSAKDATPSGLPTYKPCTGGCCSSASGHACCGFNIPASIGEVPPGRHASQVFSYPSLRDGINPEAVRKPPRSCA